MTDTTLDLTLSPHAAVEIRVATDQPPDTPLTVTVQYLDEPRRPVRGLDALTGHPGSFVVLDYEIPYQTTLHYDVQVGTDYAAASIVSPDVDDAWLRDVLFPDDSMRLYIGDHNMTATTSRSALLAPVGRSNVVAVTDVRSGRAGDSVLVTFTAAEAASLRRLLTTGHVLLLTGPASWHLGPTYWVALDVGEERVGGALSTVIRWKVQWVEVDPPDVLLLRTPRTYDQANDVYATYLAQRAVPYSEMLYPTSGAARTATGPRRWLA